MSSLPLSRRRFLGASAAATTALALKPYSLFGARKVSPNEKLNLGVVGVGGRGGEDLAGVAGENIVALCDVDSAILAGAKAKFPKAATYSDFRRMLDRKDLDGVVIGTPDHTHAVIAIAALQSGRHTYCEKPLTHTITEMRRMEEVARKSGLQTQTGNQIHSTRNYRRVVELIQGNVIGPVTEVHHWAGSVWETKPWPQAEPVPATLDYEQWIGPVQPVPFSKEFVPFNWRRWWHFGGGTLTDFCCHHMDLGVWALQLGMPYEIEADGPAPDAHCAPTGLHVRYQFGGRGHLPPVTMHWHSGAGRPQIEGVPDLTKWGGGSLFIGEKGMLLADYGRHLLLPEEKFKDAALPGKSLADSVGHHEEWIRACKGENLALPQFAAFGKTNSPFSYGALLTEIGILGNIAFRTGKRIEWDAEKLRAKGVPEADRFIHHDYRKGWKLG